MLCDDLLLFEVLADMRLEVIPHHKFDVADLFSRISRFTTETSKRVRNMKGTPVEVKDEPFSIGKATLN